MFVPAGRKDDGGGASEAAALRRGIVAALTEEPGSYTRPPIVSVVGRLRPMLHASRSPGIGGASLVVIVPRVRGSVAA